MRSTDKEPTWSTGDKIVMGLIVGLHAFSIWYFTHLPPPEPEVIPAVIQVSMILPPDAPPPPPEPPKPPPPQPPKVIPKTPPPMPIEQPKVVTEVPVQAPIPPPPPAPPTPPPPPTPPTPPTTGQALVYKKIVKPDYPRKARQYNIEGSGIITVSVNEKGLVTATRIKKSSGNFDLDNAAKSAFLKCEFVPKTINGVPVAAEGDMPFDFHLADSK